MSSKKKEFEEFEESRQSEEGRVAPNADENRPSVE
jgi:hypothetical protein